MERSQACYSNRRNHQKWGISIIKYTFIYSIIFSYSSLEGFHYIVCVIHYIYPMSIRTVCLLHSKIDLFNESQVLAGIRITWVLLKIVCCFSTLVSGTEFKNFSLSVSQLMLKLFQNPILRPMHLKCVFRSICKLDFISNMR